MVGNSSSGLAEAPSFQIGTINIGDRQKGRIKADSVIDCEPKKESIKQAFGKLYLKEFQEKLKTVQNPYGEGCASQKIIEEIKKTDLMAMLKKSFYNLGTIA
jgi:GDP/UDP-N,N'-diacetylbacillosamine 2-epimerase (hydrolysing)